MVIFCPGSTSIEFISKQSNPPSQTVVSNTEEDPFIPETEGIVLLQLVILN